MRKMSWREYDIVTIKNAEITCKNCVYVTDMAGICPKYPGGKPKKILTGGKCDRKIKT